MKTSAAVLSHGAIWFSAFHTQKNGHFVKCWLWTPLAVKGLKVPFRGLNARDTAYLKLSFAPIQNFVL